MRSVLTLSIFLATVFVAEPTYAQNLPWCAIMDNDGSTQCNYYTQQQCLQTLSGIGGECIQNPAGKRAAAGAGRAVFRKCARSVAPSIAEPGPATRDWAAQRLMWDGDVNRWRGAVQN